ncbi:MAG TPA: IS4 family transposase, partial [Ktedonobacteraceae bacterium]|nr:IS4 family transposase [Ktedonobacteraceae bacterium]
MTTLSQESNHLQKQDWDEELAYLLKEKACELARETGFVKRKSPITGAVFAQTLIFGFLSQPEASYTQLQQMMAMQGVTASAQALEKRMSKAAATFMQRLLEAMMGICVSSEPVCVEVLQRFNGVYLQDGTVIGLPHELEGEWRGFGGNTEKSGRSAVNAQVRLNLSTGGMQGPWLQDARACEREGEGSLEQTPLPKGALWLTDMGFFTIKTMRQMDVDGRYWLNYAKADLKLIDHRGVKYSLPQYLAAQGTDHIDEMVTVGVREQLSCRLIALRVSEEVAEQRSKRANKNTKGRAKGSRPDVRVGQKRKPPKKDGRKRHRPGHKRLQLAEWTVLLTNVPAELLTGHEGRVLMRARWQIELLWRLWKERGQVDIWRSEKAMRILCEVYAKLMAMVLQHWLTLLGCWDNPHRSIVKASQAVQLLAPSMVLSLTGLFSFKSLLLVSARMMQRASLNSRAKRPNTS